MTLGVVPLRRGAVHVETRKKPAPAVSQNSARSLNDHLRAIRAGLAVHEQAMFDRGIARMRQTPGGLARVAQLSVSDAIAELRFEMRCSPLIPRDGDPA